MNQKIKTVDLTKMAMLVAIMCVSAYIVIPIPISNVSITAQTLVVSLIGLLLNKKQAAITIIVYILLGMVGLPVFSGGTGGAARIVGPTGGYLVAWILCVVLISACKGKGYKLSRYLFVTICIATPVSYFFGSVWMMIGAHMTLAQTMIAAVIPFIPLDIVKCVIACILAKALNHAMSKTGYAVNS